MGGKADVCARLSWLGVRLDEAANAKAPNTRISKPDSSVKIHVITADEEAMTAHHAHVVLGKVTS